MSDEQLAENIVNHFFQKGAKVGVKDFKYLKEELAKQRTQLLKEVREKVEGKCSKHRADDLLPARLKGCEGCQVIHIQLKKLKGLENEKD